MTNDKWQYTNSVDYGSTQHRRNIRRLVRFLSRKKIISGKVIDVGCGRRNHLPEVSISNAVSEYRTLDQHYEHNPDYITDACDMEGVPTGYFDFIICTEMLEHTPNPRKAIASIYNIAAPGARLLITVPFWKEIHSSISQEYYFRFTAKGVEAAVDNLFAGRIRAFGATLSRPLGVYGLLTRLG